MTLFTTDQINTIESKLLSKLTKHQLESTDLNFKTIPQIKGTNIISLTTIPDNNRILCEDIALDFSSFGRGWNNVSNKIATSLSLSETGKFQIMSNSIGGIYLSSDYGNNWSLAGTSTVVPIFENQIIVGYNDSVIYTGVSISTNGKYLTVVGSTGILVSINYGNDWVNTNDSSSIWLSICMSSNGEIQYASNNQGLYKSLDYGFTWKLITNTNNRIKCSGSGQYLITSNNNSITTILYSGDYGSTFNLSDSPILIWVDVQCSTSGQYQTAITNNGIVYISDNYGKNWTHNTYFYDILTSVSISGSGKYQLISGVNIYFSKNYGSTWNHIEINDIQIYCTSLSFDGKVAMLSSDRIYSSIILSTYIKESGMDNFSPLDQSLFGTFTSIPDSVDIITNLISEIGTNNIKIVTSKTGKNITIVVNSGHIWTSTNFGTTFIKNETIGVKKWTSVAMSNTGKYQTAIVDIGEIWRSDDKAITWNQITSSPSIGTYNMNDIVISNNGKYQSICGDGGNIMYSYDSGYNWISNTINSNNLKSITMSDDGKYQSVCGYNDNSNSNMYSKTFGANWKYSNLQNSSIQWISISSSSCGQYITMCSSENNIIISEDYGVNWNDSLSGSNLWTSVYVTPDGQRQLATIFGGGVYISLDFGYTWTSCYSSTNILLGLTVTDTLQYIFIMYTDGIIISKIINDNKIPGVVTISTKFDVIPNAVILLSGSNANIYSYDTNFTNSFDIISSNLEDNGQISYEIISYGQTFD